MWKHEQEMVRDGELGKSAVVGNMVHTVFQHLMAGDDWSERTILAAMTEAVAQSQGDLIGVGVSSTEEALQELRPYVPHMIRVLDTYRTKTPRARGGGAGCAGGGRRGGGSGADDPEGRLLREGEMGTVCFCGDM